MERLALAIALAVVVVQGERLQVGREVRMVRGKRRLPDGEPTPEQNLGLRWAPLGQLDARQIVEGRGDIGMPKSECRLPGRESPQEARFGPRQVTVLAVERPEAVEGRRDLGVEGAQRLLLIARARSTSGSAARCSAW